MICMAVSSLDILNLSHSFKDVCEAHAKSPECLSCTLRLLLEYNLIQANLEYSRRFCCAPQAPDDTASKKLQKGISICRIVDCTTKTKKLLKKKADSGKFQ